MAGEKEKIKEMDDKPDDLFELRMSIKQNIWFSYLLPAAFCCAVYIADIATDIALVERHFADRHSLFASITLLLIYTPPLVFLIITLADLEKWPSEEQGSAVKVKWIAQQIALFVFFPVHAVYRFAGSLFWSTEALLCPESQQEECLQEATKPAYAELYLLLQAFFQAAPQAVFQTYILTLDDIDHDKAGSVQALSILTSIASVGISAACYMRFESQRLAGRPVPWDVLPEKKTLEPKESLMTTIESQITSDTNDNSPTENPEEEVTNSPKPPPLPKGVPQSAIMSLPPLPPQIRARLWKATGDDELPEELQKHLGNEEAEAEPLNIRVTVGGKSPNKETTDPTIMEPPDFPAPPPPPPLDMFDEEEEDQNTTENENSNNETVNSETKTESNNEDTARQSPTTEPQSEEPLSNEPLLEEPTAKIEVKAITPPKDFTTIPLPTRKWKVTGLGEDDAMGKATGFVWWFLFVTSRVLTFAALAHFIPWAFLALVLLHYLGMISFLFYNDKSKEPSTILLKLSLGFVYLFCFMEIRTKFKKPIMFSLIFVAVGFAENMIFSMVWFYGLEFDNWWFNYVFVTIVVTILMSIGVMIFYLFALKPNNVDIYEE